MKIKIKKEPNRLIAKKLKTTVQFFAEKLFGKNNLKIYIYNEAVLGARSATGSCFRLHPTEHKYGIFISSSVRHNFKQVEFIIAHEMSHIKQLFSGTLIDAPPHIIYKGIKYDIDRIPWEKRPWEIEAYELTRFLLENYLGTKILPIGKN